MKRLLARHWADLSIVLAFFVLSGLLYAVTARDYWWLAGYFKYDNVLFQADHLDALKGWVSRHKGNHPLVLLVVVPLSSLLAKLAGSYPNGLLAFCGLTGGATVAAFYGLLRMIVDRWAAVALNAFFALSMSQLFLACIADTYELVALSLIPSFALMLHCMRTGKLYFHLWVLAGLLSFSITSVSLVQTLICLSLVLLRRRDLRLALKALPATALIVLLLGAGLNLFQLWLFPGSKLFFAPDIYTHELIFVTPLIVDHPGAVAAELVKTFLLFAFVGQEPRFIQFNPGDFVELVYFRAAVDYGWAALAAVTLWLVLFVRGLVRSLGDRETALLTWAAVLSVLSNAALFSFYSTDEMYLYTPHFSFITILAATSRRSMNRRYVTAAWLLLAALTGYSNLATQRDITKLYGIGTETVIDKGAEWRYFIGRRDPGDWTAPEFDDSSWASGPSGFGYGDHDDATDLSEMRDHASVVFTRHSFELERIDPRQELVAHVRYDDAFVMYLNGVEVARANAPPVVTHDSRAQHSREAGQPLRYRIPITFARDGRNTLAVAGINSSATSSDLTLEVVLWRAAKRRY